ncbi:MAG: hypothetical protein H8F28_06400 [Fibrella sp.]|nr:hypothetical protein [Armatimonadota bacterium]
MNQMFYADCEPIFTLTLPVTEEAAYEAVSEYLASITYGMEMVIHNKPSGNLWMYYYQSAGYIRTQDISQALAGNAPILIDTITGEAFVTGTAEPIEEYIAAYRRRQEPEQ